MTVYVCGFAFEPDQRVHLILKRRPDWQQGFLNGIGGKIEPGETSLRAMSRKFKDEAGLDIHISRWKFFHRESWMNGNSVDFYACGLQPGECPTTQTDEQIMRIRWHNLSFMELRSELPLMYNLPYLLPMAYIHLYGSREDIPYHPIKD